MVLVPPLTFCASETVLLGGALLAESSGITSPEENGFSLVATRDEGPRDFAPDVVEGLLLFSATFRALADVDMVGRRP